METTDEGRHQLKGSCGGTEPLAATINEGRLPTAMSASPEPGPGSRSAAEARYRAMRNLAFQPGMQELAAANIHAELRGIDAPALAFADQWTNRLVGWEWRKLADQSRRNHPNRFEVAIWQNGLLCGLCLGRPAPAVSHLSLHFLEANPDHANPLRGKIALVAFTAARHYAIALGKVELRLVNPLPPVVPFYCSSHFGFELVAPANGEPYCRRSI